MDSNYSATIAIAIIAFTMISIVDIYWYSLGKHATRFLELTLPLTWFMFFLTFHVMDEKQLLGGYVGCRTITSLTELAMINFIISSLQVFLRDVKGKNVLNLGILGIAFNSFATPVHIPLPGDENGGKFICSVLPPTYACILIPLVLIACALTTEEMCKRPNTKFSILIMIYLFLGISVLHGYPDDFTKFLPFQHRKMLELGLLIIAYMLARRQVSLDRQDEVEKNRREKKEATTPAEENAQFIRSVGMESTPEALAHLAECRKRVEERKERFLSGTMSLAEKNMIIAKVANTLTCLNEMEDKGEVLQKMQEQLTEILGGQS